MLSMNIKSTALKLMTLVVCASLFSFSPGMGGDRYQIYLNKKLLLEQFVSQTFEAKTLQLNQKDYNGQIDIYYSHCGETGKARNITIKDGQNQVLKEWHFSDGDNTAMTCKVKDILNLQGKNNKLNLYYSSQQLPKGRLLASIVVVNDNKTATLLKK